MAEQRNSTPSMSDDSGVRLMPPKVFFMCLMLGGGLEFFVPSELPFMSYPYSVILGLIVGLLGFALMMMAHETFKKVGTSVPLDQSASQCVTQSVYRWTRNPMYIGGSAFFLGIAMVSQSFWMVLAYFPLAFYLGLYVVPREEAYMARAFGQDYLDYCLRVRRWL